LGKQIKKNGQRRPATIREVAVDLGLSVATVSRALTRPELLREDTRARVLEAVERLGYQPNLIARGLRLRESRLVFVVVPSLSSFFLDVFRGVERAARECDYTVLMGHTERNPDREQMFFDQVASGRADGVILVSSSDAEAIAKRTRRMPAVVAALEDIEGQDIPTVRIDHIAAATDATNHLLSLGHTRVAHIAGPRRSSMAAHRRQGFDQAIFAAGLNPNAFPRLNGGFTVAWGTEAMETLLALESRPTAVFAANDEIAIGAIQAIKHAGLKVAHDISVIGFDDQRIATLYEPPLTTIKVPTEEIGYRSMLLLLSQILDGGANPENSVLATSLVVRATTGPPPA
jgi:LacI family repressor for deo operon, udp, cdd, tsx, nupC, and nupG